MIEILLNNPLLLLFTVVTIGYPLGRIGIGGHNLGVASVLFAGLAVGSLHPDLKLPEVVYVLGLVLFVYTIGLSHGRGFFASFRRKGLRDTLLVLGVLGLAAGLTMLAQRLLGIRPTVAVGMYAGSLTNTPALASVLEYLKEYAPKGALEQMLADPVVGYSVVYPMGVIGMLAAIALVQRLWQIDYAAEAARLREPAALSQHIANYTIEVTNPEAERGTVHELADEHGWDVLFGRVRHDGGLALATNETRLRTGDLVSVIGTTEELDQVTKTLGVLSDQQLELDRSEIDFRRIFVSSPLVAGRPLRDLGVRSELGAVVTRVRRGDVEFVPHGDTVLELGDRVRVVTPRDNMETVTRFFGDSYRALSEIDIPTFSLGLALGLLLGILPLPIMGGVSLKLGLAGGPLVVALVLGALERTGPFVWSLPYSANLTLRQIGLILFLAGVGTRAGYAFVTMLSQGGGLMLFLAGATITFTVALTTLWVAHKLLHIPMGITIGMLAGIQTQPAVLGFALEQTKNELPNLGYAAVYPIATVAKILVAQALIAFLM
ncbi:MAG: transporter [Chloroflexi bacterium]|nr:transporter [Chloroflexota bacterium]